MYINKKTLSAITILSNISTKIAHIETYIGYGQKAVESVLSGRAVAEPQKSQPQKR